MFNICLTYFDLFSLKFCVACCIYLSVIMKFDVENI